MADSRREKILQAVHAALDAAGKPAGVTVNRDHVAAIGKGELPMITLYAGVVGEGLDETLAVVKAGAADRRLRFTVRSRVVAAAAGAGALDAISQWVTSAVPESVALGSGNAVIAEEGSKFNSEQGSDGVYLLLDTIFTARFVTRRNDLTL